MIAPITIRYPFRPKRRSLAVADVADLFGLGGTEPDHVVAENLQLDLRPGDLALFVGPSGSGKSSIMRAAAAQLETIDAAKLALPEVPLVDALPGRVDDRLATLSACGLGEARLMLRTPAELSDGQRDRFRIAYALSKCTEGSFVVLDEFTAALDRTLAKVVAFNVRKLVTRSGVGLLAATTHEDIVDDLQPDLLVRCGGDGAIEQSRWGVKKKG